jgi:spoIIIJ-associated protein
MTENTTESAVVDGTPAAADATDGHAAPRAALEGSDLLDAEGDAAADYLETLLDIADLDGDIDIDVEGDRASVSVVGENLTSLIGRDGATLDALQELSRLAVMQQTGERSRLMLDIGGYRSARRRELTQLGNETAEQVLSMGEPVALRPMSAFERKVVHDAIAAVDGVRSESEGVDAGRHIVVHPA